MENYVTVMNDYFEILVPSSLRNYGEEVLNYSTDKLKEFLTFFKEERYSNRIRGAFLINRSDFINRIKEVSSPNVTLPPEWATGCFYGGETQILLDENEPYKRFETLIHESFHLLISEFVYERNNIDRILWLDEALAGNFDGTMEKIIKNNTFEKIIIDLLNKNQLPKMNELSFSKNNVITEEYNGYDLFKVVGRYLMETKTKEELLEYINNKDKVIIDGEMILEESLNYFRRKYNLK